MAADPNSLIVRLEIGDKISSYVVIKQLGEGTFGAVYKVRNADGDEFALKTEHISMKLLQLELKVMSMLKNTGSRYCCLLEDKGRTDTFTYVVMKLVGGSLQDMKKTGPDKHLSTGCALSVSLQCLEGLRELHSIGFLHRDIKPGNYAIGLESLGEIRRIYLLDFGMCKPYKAKGLNDQVSTETVSKGKFRGTPRYAPLASHKLQDHCRRDDIESWFYMLIDFCNASLPWKVSNELNDIGRIKQECRSSPMLDTMLKEVPAEMQAVLDHIDGLGFYDPPDYALMANTIRRAIETHSLQETPYDWEANMPKEDKEEEKKIPTPTPSNKTAVNISKTKGVKGPRQSQSVFSGGGGGGGTVTATQKIKKQKLSTPSVAASSMGHVMDAPSRGVGNKKQAQPVMDAPSKGPAPKKLQKSRTGKKDDKKKSKDN